MARIIALTLPIFTNMKYLILLVSLLINTALLYVLGTRELLPVPLGAFLSPQEGIWQNAESVEENFNEDIKIKGIKSNVQVVVDDKLVPHVFAEQENDAYFVQGYLHAKFRLWQMEFQTLAAAGRLSEIVGSKALKFDRNQRRLGMVYAAENALVAMEQDPATKSALDAYTAGVNSYINELDNGALPVEYKLLGYTPELWSNLKSALFTKQMTQVLAGYDNDLEMTEAFQILGEENFRILYAALPDSLSPVIPNFQSTELAQQSLLPPASADSLYFRRKDTLSIVQDFKPDPSNGSNNWVVSGSKTKSGKPILANDPHLGLSLPSIWYEMQITTPAYNAYGVSFPGLPGVVIGFNDSIAFGFTNAGRDVKDYYEIQFKDDKKDEYWFDSSWQKTTKRIELINIRDSLPFRDTVAYSIFGPVIYDRSFEHSLSPKKAIALRWVAHDTSNILKMWFQLNRAKNYNDYLEAISHFNVPGQNMVFAAKNGDIALWQQANFPLRWKDQGIMVMPGSDSSFFWNGYIPFADNPHALNPVEGFLSSANQRPVDVAYPYFIPGKYEVYRPITINRALSSLSSITVKDMMDLQNNNYNVFAEFARPILLQYINRDELSNEERRYVDLVENWDLQNSKENLGVVCFSAWWDSLSVKVFNDELTVGDHKLPEPDRFVLLEALKRDTSFRFIDDIKTPELESLNSQVTAALKSAAIRLAMIEKEGKLKWGEFKNTTVYHLLKTNAIPFARTGIITGGGEGIVNATKHDHGPSWRMIVHLTDPIEAYGIYPGGQSGNPGSKYYDNYIDTWSKGEYHKIKFMDRKDLNKSAIKWKINFTAI
jgi:penicillin amidase